MMKDGSDFMTFDFILRGGTVIDGSGNAPFFADVAIKNGKIAAVGQLGTADAAQTLDAAGFCVTPGFLDIHRHGDTAVFREDFGIAELRQGLTSVLNGACGLSVAPFGEAHRQELEHYLLPVTGDLDPAIPTHSIGAYLDALRAKKLRLNAGMMVGGGTLRADLCGYRQEAPEDFSALHRRLETALSEGARAVSLGLGYAPECFYSTDELIAALSPLQNGQIPIAVHMREEGDAVCEAIAEMVTVAKALNCPLHISHLKAMGMRNWRKRIPTALKIMQRARDEGVDLTCDVYLYEAGSTQLLHLLPPDFLVGGTEVISERLRVPTEREKLRERIQNGKDFDNIAQMIGWDNIRLSTMRLPEYQPLIGKTITEAAELLRLDPVDCLCQVLSDEHCAVTMIDRINCEDDICEILRDPYAAVISDATYPVRGLPHPRVYGNVTRLFERFVRDKGVLTLTEAVRKVTSLPADAMRLTGKGRLAVGMDADVNVFRLEELHECATYLAPRQESLGMDTVLVGGVPAILHGALTGTKNGSVI